MEPSDNAPTERLPPSHGPPPGPTPEPPAPDHYHALFHRMDQGFCVLELQLDDTGQHTAPAAGSSRQRESPLLPLRSRSGPIHAKEQVAGVLG